MTKARFDQKKNSPKWLNTQMYHSFFKASSYLDDENTIEDSKENSINKLSLKFKLKFSGRLNLVG